MYNPQAEVLFEKAANLIQKGEWEKAIPLYEKLINTNPLEEKAYDRLMILLRKQKDYKKELAVINKGIKAFRDSYESHSKNSLNRKALQLSKALLMSTGLADKKGIPLYQVEPVGRWTKRKQVVEKKLKK